jgi:hypothetical protein
MDVQARLVTKPAEGTKTVIRPASLPALKDQGPVNCLCGGCRAKIAEQVYKEQMRNVVIRCPICGNYSEVTQW